MPAPLMQIDTPDTLPDSADVVVIGAGIVGVSAAYWLARGGMKVVLLEKGRIGAEQSSRNWGWCRQQNRDARELPLSTRSLALWEDMTADIGQDMGFRRCGLLYLSNNQAEIDGWDRWGQFARGQGVDTRMLTADQASERGAATGKRWHSSVRRTFSSRPVNSVRRSRMARPWMNYCRKPLRWCGKPPPE